VPDFFSILLGEELDPHLPNGKIDLVLVVGLHQEFPQPKSILRKIHEALKRDARLVLIEYRPDDPSAPMRGDQKMTIAGFRAEVEPEGFHFHQVLGILQRQLIRLDVTEVPGSKHTPEEIRAPRDGLTGGK
jgi:SAM-dependent methyltransferase